jgi:hypothetical protein
MALEPSRSQSTADRISGSSSWPAWPDPYYPDGLDRAAIETLLAEAARERAKAPAATSALLDGSAAERRSRRVELRALAEIVRALPARPAATKYPTHIQEAS